MYERIRDVSTHGATGSAEMFTPFETAEVTTADHAHRNVAFTYENRCLFADTFAKHLLLYKSKMRFTR